MKKLIYIFLLVTLGLSKGFTQTNIDSLWSVWKDPSQADTNRMEAIKKIAWEGYLYSEPDSAFYFAQLHYDFAKKKGMKKQMAAALNTQGVSFQYKGDYGNAMFYYNQSLKIREETGDKRDIAASLNNIGFVYGNQGDYHKAITYFTKSLKIQEEIGNKKGVAASLNSIGSIYANQNDYSKAKTYYAKSLKLEEELENKLGVANSLVCLGVVYKEQSNYQKAITYFTKSIKIYEELGNKRGKALSLGNLGNIYKEQSNYINALYCFTQGLQINEDIRNKQGIAGFLNSIGNLYAHLGNYQKAIIYSEKALKIAQEVGTLIETKGAANTLFNSYKAIKQYPKALEMHELYISSKDSLLSEKNQRAIFQQEYQYNYEKQAAVDSIKTAEAKKVTDAQITAQKIEIKAKRNQQYALFGGLFLVVMFAGFMYNRFRVTRQQKQIITQQKHLVEEKHREITDSINYAERIQRSFLATTEMLDEHLKDYFVFFRPKDVVSGDFYWAGELNNGNFAFSVADSTGHGVPGAIMSILNISSLEKSIEQETAPDKILNQTRKIIIERLKKDGSSEGGKDGMDCSLLVINKDRTQLSFAAANNPVFIVRPIVIARETKQSSQSRHSEPVEESMLRQAQHDKNVVRNDGYELIEFKPNKMPVGKHDNDAESFTLNTTLLQKDDVIYTLTDGFPDQFGGDKGKKYMIKNLKELLLQIAHLPVLEQEQKLADEFDKWKGENEQVDDVCIIGVRI